MLEQACTGLPAASFPAATPDLTMKAWPGGVQPTPLQCWPSSMAFCSIYFRTEDGRMDCYPAVATKLRECSRIHRTGATVLDQHTAHVTHWPVRMDGPVNAMAW